MEVLAMARPISWLPRLHEIRRSVANSVRSHYSRAELQQLFELQPRAAARLLESLPTVTVNGGYLVRREDLSAFLDHVHEGEDAHLVLQRARAGKATSSRRKIRSLVRRDIAPRTLEAVPQSLTLESGRVSIRFDTVTQLGEALLALALILESDGDEFARRYEVIPPEVEDEGVRDVKAMFAALATAEKQEPCGRRP
jgi:hypothetical protein